MTRIAALLMSTLFLFPMLSLPVLAQPAERPGPGPGWGYGRMWGDGGDWSWHYGMGPMGPFMMLLVIVVTVALIVWLVRALSHRHGFGHGGGPYHPHSALDLLAERFARGEIDKDEFEAKRRILRG